MNKKSIILLLVAVFLLSLTGCTHKQVSEAPELLEPAGYTMDTAVVERGRVAFKRYFTGEIVPDVQEAAFTTGGKLERLTVTYGDVVKEGDVLAILDLTEVEEQMEDLTWQMEYQAKTNALPSISCSWRWTAASPPSTNYTPTVSHGADGGCRAWIWRRKS